MMEGVLRHCTEMEVEQQYVDSHGQSEVAFAFSHLLGFDLMPRLKAIASQKLSRPTPGNVTAYPNLQPILTQPINWALIRQQYDDIVKYATALRLGTAEAESILRRFTRTSVQHPTYLALAELGKAVETLWLCAYSDRGVRRMLERCAAAAGLARNVSPHQLRHYLFTGLKRQGIDDALIQPYSGYASRPSRRRRCATRRPGS